MSNDLPDFGPSPSKAKKKKKEVVEQLEIPFEDEESDEEDEYDIDYDFGDDYGLLPEGVYDAYVTSAQTKTSKSGNKMIQWDFILLTGSPGYPLTTWTVFSKSSLWKLEEVGGALGVLDRSEGLRIRFNLNDVKYSLCQLVVGHGEYNGRETENVKTVLPWPAGIGTKYEPKGKLP